MLMGRFIEWWPPLSFMKQLSLTLDEHNNPEPESNNAKAQYSVKDIFRAPKNIRLGDYYISLGGRVFLAMKYVVTGKTSTGYPIVELQVKEGREDFDYKYLAVEAFSQAIASGRLVLVA